MQDLAWSAVQSAASEAFNVWSNRSDYEFAKDAWGRLEAAGACRYSTERERHIVASRFLALASIYLDWCDIAFGDCYDDDLTCWAAELELKPLFIGQLCPEEELGDDSDEAYASALRSVVVDERRTVARALITAYGGVAALYCALQRSADNSEADGETPSEAEPLLDTTMVNVAAYGWIDDECPPWR